MNDNPVPPTFQDMTPVYSHTSTATVTAASVTEPPGCPPCDCNPQEDIGPPGASRGSMLNCRFEYD